MLMGTLGNISLWRNDRCSCSLVCCLAPCSASPWGSSWDKSTAKGTSGCSGCTHLEGLQGCSHGTHCSFSLDREGAFEICQGWGAWRWRQPCALRLFQRPGEAL